MKYLIVFIVIQAIVLRFLYYWLEHHQKIDKEDAEEGYEVADSIIFNLASAIFALIDVVWVLCLVVAHFLSTPFLWHTYGGQ